MFQNPFSDKKDEKNAKENIPPPDEKEEDKLEAENDGIQVEEGDGAIQHLIYYSFYPATCMVPLGEDFISIKENVPDLMKAQSNDTLLQETIKTFHGLMQEKDDEILNLRIQLKDVDSTAVKMVSETIQTDLTLDACEEMERQLNELSEGLPDKVEKIHQLQLEKTRLQESIQGPYPDDPSKISKLEDDLCESLKNLQELEECNLTLSKENKDLKQSNLELTWQLEEVNDLKMEVELAKIQTEEDMNKIKDTFHEKDKLIQKLKDNVKNGGEIEGTSKLAQDPQMKNSTPCAIQIEEYETMRTEYDQHILELELRLKEAENGCKESDISEVPKLIEKIKDNIFESSATSVIANLAGEMLPRHAGRFKTSDPETIEELVALAMVDDTTEDDMKAIVMILGAVDFGENGRIEESYFSKNVNDDKRKKEIKDKGKNDLQQDVLNLGLMVKVQQSLHKMEMKEIRKEFMKLEIILNFLNRTYKPTPLTSVSSLPKIEVIRKIVETKARIYDICMHTFWETVVSTPSGEKKAYDRFSITSVDINVFKRFIFPSFIEEKTFRDFLQILVNVREILLAGEASKIIIKSEDLQFMKMKGLSVYYDLCNHVLPIFPKEIRYVLMGRSIEEMTSSDSKLLNNICPDFLSILHESTEKNPLDVSAFLFDLLSILDFEDDLFSTLSKTSSSEFKVYKLSISNITNKTESSLAKIPMSKNNKNMILKRIEELQNVMKNFEWTYLPASYSLKTENELMKILIEKKESTLKIIFKSSFRPVIEKISLNKGATLFSCVSKEFVGLDYWVKSLLDKYRLKQLKQLNDLSVEEMENYLMRLEEAMKLVSPSYLVADADLKKNKGKLATMIFKTRRMLRGHIDQYLFRTASKFQMNQSGKEMINEDKNNELHLEKTFQNLKDVFHSPKTSKETFNDVLQRLYEIDYEIYPGPFEQDIEKKDFLSLSEGAIFEEILKLRLYIAVYVIAPYQRFATIQNQSTDLIGQFAVLKEIEATLTKADFDIIDDNLIITEYKLLKTIVGNLKKKKYVDDTKLKECFLHLRKVECGIDNEVFDSAKGSREFERMNNNKEKSQLVFSKAENILHVWRKNNMTRKDSNKLLEHYVELDELLHDIEEAMPVSTGNGKTIWKYVVRDKTNEILKLISQKESDNNTEGSPLQEHIMNNLDDIKSWALECSDWRRECFIRLNNLLRRVNNGLKNRKIQTLSLGKSEMVGMFQDEKEAFEKAFSQLEERLGEFGEDKRKSNGDGLGLEGKSDDELKSIIIGFEKEISRREWTTADEEEANSWLCGRKREELIDDCNNLVNKSLMTKINNLLERETDKERTYGRPIKDNQISQLEDDINAKLAKYEELCQTVEQLKIPQRQRRNGPTDNLQAFDTTDRRRNEMVSSYDNQLNGRMNNPTSRMYSSQTYLPINDDDIDDYFQQRMKELQKFIKFPHNSNEKEKPPRSYANSEINVIVDGFEIEDQKTPRYYSMKLQDIKHDRKEDEMGAMIHHIEKHRLNLLAENDNLQEQLYVSKSIQENQNLRLVTLEKTEDMLRKRLAALDSEVPLGPLKPDSLQEMEVIKHEKQNLSTIVAMNQKKMDQLNSEVIALSTSNSNLQHDNHNLVIKNQYLERSMQKLEETYADLMQHLATCQSNSEKGLKDNHADNIEPSQYEDKDKRLRVNEMEKIELVKKLDIIDQQNKLLRKHCEKMNSEISSLTKKLAEANDKSETYLMQTEKLAEVLDKSKMDNRKVESSLSVRIKDDEIKNLKNKILHLETRLLSAEESPSGDRLKQELMSNKDKEISRLKDQIGSLQDRVEETMAQIEVKDYENQKLVAMTRKLQNKINDDSYFPPTGYKIVKDS